MDNTVKPPSLWDIWCNQSAAFNFYGSDYTMFIIIALHFFTLLLILVLMIRLCHRAFSYSNFHILEAYKYYVLLFIATLLIMLARFCQYQTKKALDQVLSDVQKKSDYEQDQLAYEGWVILNSIVTMASFFIMNQAYVQCGFTWLMISMGCDFTDADTFVRDQIDQQLIIKMRKIKKIKKILLYFIMPAIALIALVLMPLFGNYCVTSQILMIISSFIAMFMMCFPLVALLKKRFDDPVTPKKTKALWIFLIVTMTLRSIILVFLLIYGLVHRSKEDTKQDSISKIVSQDALFLIYGFLCTFGPLLATTYLAQIQLKKQMCGVLKGSSAMIFGSVVM